MPLRRKVGLMALMALSIFTMVASIMKTVTSQTNSGETDPQYSASLAILWSGVEQGLVIVMGCIPPTQAYLKDLSVWRSISGSMASILGKGSSRNTRRNSSYTELELDTGKHGLRGDRVEATACASSHQPSGVLVEQNLHIHRSDTYSVSFGRESHSTGANAEVLSRLCCYLQDVVYVRLNYI